MMNATRSFGIITIAIMWAANAAAQELPLPDAGGAAAAPDLSVPALGGDEVPNAAMSLGDEASVVGSPNAVDVESFDGYHTGSADDCQQYGEGVSDMWAEHGTTIESSGTWLRRGFWYAEADAVVWTRHWNRDAKFFAAQDVNVLDPNFFPRSPNFAGQEPQFSTNRLLTVDGSQPGEDASVRATLGHFLFRDSRNRDHTTEFTVLGGGDWHQHRVLSSEDNFGLFVPFYISGNNRAFNAATRQTVDYSSHFSSFEWNYHVKKRPGRDQMIMDANGNWHRAAQKGFATDYLVGLRFLESRDILDWRAEDIQVQGDDGSYLIRTDNDMFGFQIGTGLTYETSRWSLGYQVKGGVFINDALGRTTLDFTADNTSDADLRLTNDELSFVGEARLTARWYLLPDFSLRAAYEMMYLTSQALAPNQATFITDFSYLNTSQDPFYYGVSFGFEGYW